MNDPVISRAAINADAKNAAERFIATGADQPNPNLPDTDAFAQWAADYSRWTAALVAVEGTESGA
jgi:hypothetical protein